jgi:hypothetical protein
MNRYLGITQVTTASHNPRSNGVVERFMQHLNGCLTKCDDNQYNNMQDYLPAVAFAHNTAFNSAINCTPFEAGHGLQARTITEARAGPRLQIVAEGGMDLIEADKNWEKSLSPKVLKLAERLASEAQRQSQWHKRTNAHNLNQFGSRVEDKGLSPGDRVYFYKPPTQQEVARMSEIRQLQPLELHYLNLSSSLQRKGDGRDIDADRLRGGKNSAKVIVYYIYGGEVRVGGDNGVEEGIDGGKDSGVGWCLHRTLHLSCRRLSSIFTT